MWDRLGDHSPYDDLDITNDRIERWHPLNQSLYVGYKVMLAGLLLMAKGDRIAMNSSVETRYPLLDDDVIAFLRGDRSRIQVARTDGQMDPPPGGRAGPCPPQIANRPKTMFRGQPSEAFFGPNRPPWVDQLLSPSRSRRPAGLIPRPSLASEPPRPVSRESPPGESSWTSA